MLMRGLYESTKNVVALTEWRENVAKSSPNPRAKGGLTRWFAENWVDVKTGKPCGRSKAKNEAILLVDQVNVSQVRHLRLSER